MATTRKLREIALGIGIALMGAGEGFGPSTVFADALEAQPVSRRSEAGPQGKSSRLRSVADKLPLYFVENRGQVDPHVAYYVQGKDKIIFFTPGGLTLVLTDKPRQMAQVASLGGSVSPADNLEPEASALSPRRLAVKLDFVGADTRVEPQAEEPTPALISYFVGPETEWKTGLKTYTRLVYADLWPGIDLIYSGTVSRLKYMFVVKPGVDPNLIKLAYRGASGVSLDDQDRIEVRTELGSFHDDKPIAYQEVRGVVMDVDVGYELRTGPDNESYQYSFRLGSYDSTMPLIIDPAILVYAGFIGGLGDDHGNAIAVDSAGNAYITGETNSTEATFPDGNGFGAVPGRDRTQNGGVDAFVAKVDADGTTLLYASYIGGSGTDRGNGIAVDGSGNAYIVGETNSTATTFPVLVGPTLIQGGGVDVFVAKVNDTGTALVYGGFIGGSGDDRGKAIALEPGCVLDCAAYVTGETGSAQASFPETGGPDLTHNGGVDAFVAKVNATGSGLVYAGYIGGSGTDRGNGIAVDGSGSVYIVGETNSDQTTFPDGNGFGAVPGRDQTQNGGVDAFVAKVDADGTALLYATYVGGSGDDRGKGIALQPGEAGCPPDCSVYIVGETNSDQTTFPDGNGFGAVPGRDQTQNGGIDAFVAKVDADGTALLYATYLGGSGDDKGNGIVVDSAANAYIIGETNSTQTTFPETVGPDLLHNGNVDAFVAKLDATGMALLYAGYIGGSGIDRGKGIALDTNTDVYIVGETNSSELTFPDKTGPDTTQNLAFDAFVAKLCNAVCPDIRVKQSASPDPVAAGSNVTYTITVTNHGPDDDATAVTVTDALPPTTSLVTATTTKGTCSPTDPVVCDIGDLNNGDSAIVTIVVNTAPVAGTLVNNVSVLAAETDPIPSNNSSTVNTVATLPNLVITALRAPKAVLPDSTFIIQDTTKNNGQIEAPATTTRFYLSTDKIVGAGDVVLGSRPVPALMPNESDPLFSTTVTIPATPLGRYFLIGVADVDDVVAETNNTNKTTRAIRVTLPDLVVSQLRAPTSAAVGSTISVQETTRNKEHVDAAASATRFYLSSDSALGVGDVLLSGRAVPALAARGKNTAFTNVTIPLGTAPGKYFLVAVADADCADADCEVAETVETNNARSRIITITP